MKMDDAESYPTGSGASSSMAMRGHENTRSEIEPVVQPDTLSTKPPTQYLIFCHKEASS